MIWSILWRFPIIDADTRMDPRCAASANRIGGGSMDCIHTACSDWSKHDP